MRIAAQFVHSKRGFFILLIGILFSISFSVPAWAEEPARTEDDLVDTKEAENFLEEIDEGILDNSGLSTSVMWDKLLAGDTDFDLSQVMKGLGSIFFSEVIANARLMVQLIVLSLLALVLSLLRGSFSNGDISLLGRWVVYMLLATSAITAFADALTVGRETINLIGDFVLVLLPVLMPLLAAVGGVTTVTVLNPMLLVAINIFMGVLRQAILPLICFSSTIQIVGRIVPRFSADKLAKLFKDVGMGVMSVCLTVFIAFLSLSGIATSSIDGLAVKAAKTATGTFIPVVGRSLADVMDSVLGTALIMKNWIGLAGCISVIFICAVPALKLLAHALLFRIAGAVMQPLGEDVLADVLTGMGNSLTLIFAVVAISGVFAFFAVALLIGTGNVAMMMR